MKTIHIDRILILALVVLLAGCAAAGKTAVTPIGSMDNPQHLTSVAARLLEAGDTAEAQDYLERALSQDDTYVPALAGMARAASRQGNVRQALSWAAKAWENAHRREDRILAGTTRMAIYLDHRPEGWLSAMESDWKALGTPSVQAEAATWLMGRGYRQAGELPKAAVCLRQVIAWQGAHAAGADRDLAALYRQLRAEPGGSVARKVAAQKTISRGDLAALFVEELHLTGFLSAGSRKKYQGGYQPPGKTSSVAVHGREPLDMSGHLYAQDVQVLVANGFRGLEIFPDGRFYPAAPVKRANFALFIEDLLARIQTDPMLTRAFIGNESPFPDVSPQHYAFNAILVCTTRGILAVALDGAFHPGQAVSGADSLLALRQLKQLIKTQQVRY